MHCFPKTTNRCHSEEVIRGGYVTGKRSIIEIDQFRDRIVAAAQRLVAEWAGVAPETLEHTVTYGIRAYYRGTLLASGVLLRLINFETASSLRRRGLWLSGRASRRKLSSTQSLMAFAPTTGT